MIAILQKKGQVLSLTKKNSAGSHKLVVIFLVFAAFPYKRSFKIALDQCESHLILNSHDVLLRYPIVMLPGNKMHTDRPKDNNYFCFIGS